MTMYGWKLTNKLKFGRSKEEKDKDREKERDSRHNSGSKHGVFGHLSKRLSGTEEQVRGRTEEANTGAGTPRTSKDRKETIVATPNSIAPVRLSTDVAAPGWPNGEVQSSVPSSFRDAGSETTDVGDEERAGTSSGSVVPEQANHSSASVSEERGEASMVNSTGIMTIKVYNGNSFKLPFALTSNPQILGKLLSSGVNAISRTGRSSVDELISSVEQVTLSEDEDKLLPGDAATNYIPATIKLPDSEDLNPLIYLTIEFDNTVATIEPECGNLKSPVFNKISTFDVTRKLPYLKVNVFVRIPSILLPSKAWQQVYAAQDPELQDLLKKVNSNMDVQLDSFQLPLNLQFNSATSIRLYNHQWLNMEKGLGRVNITIDYKPSKNKPLSIDDFDLLKVIGKGSFGKVMQVKKKDTNKIYALKAIRKSYIVSKSEVTHTLAERTVLARVDNPFIVPLKFSFQSPEKLYLVLAFINGGELFFHLQKEGRFDLSRARFYTAELLCALETLHSLNVIYRDLKPENILLDYQGHIALCDFGLCKLNMKDQDKTNTFCGTPEYLAPELLLGQGYSKVVDWWTLGVLLYEMLTGLPPYYDEDVPKMYKKILQEPLRFPDGFDREAKNLLIELLCRDPKRRLGYNGADEIKRHPFFSQLSWKRLWMKGYIPPYKPPVMSALDTSNFDQEFTREKPVDSVVNDFLSESVQQQFGGWTYVGSEQLGSSIIPGKNIR
ncbi:ABL028Wp [Eremothecium gossypii ATCC 10895]|uniref:non-specific serine/threonine protein kinase n=1 Tax=Eremothecium gossypii (strain ATCC 10895 / CBS 109.51 / FGSC 9923 / NRRL Y-1056) TaxID=284811 RepID=Q75DP5_EREGS|nr:ABL028Wp [Eremothecium gossypii ATCC 10895]AAS50743.2 ABL028Wp [Eremothecium gossypii ATCC 10895]